MDFIYSFVKNICVFTLVITLILNVFPDSRYKKYIKLFAGILLIALIFNPVIQWKNSKDYINDMISKYTQGEYETDISINMEELESRISERMTDGY